MSVQWLSKSPGRWVIGAMVVGTVATGALISYSVLNLGLLPQQSPEPIQAAAPLKQVTALGRLEPEAEVLSIAAPLALDGDRVVQVLVREGDRVQAGQVIALLDSRDRLQDEVAKAQEQVEVARAKLAQVQAGAKTGEILAQQATITRLQAELAGEMEAQTATIARWQSEVKNARAEYERFSRLYQAGAVSASELDDKRLVLETAQAQLDEVQAKRNQTISTLQAQLREARATLDRVAEVRPVDVQAAQMEVNQAIAALKQAKTNLEQVYIRAPMAGQILKIHTQPGEKISESGIAELGQTAQMVAVAEVYQTDIGKIRLGQTAIVTGQAFSGKLQGTVSQIGLQVNRQNVFSNQPGENLDRRVVEVEVRLNPEDSQKIAGLTNLQVQVAVQLQD